MAGQQMMAVGPMHMFAGTVVVPPEAAIAAAGAQLPRASDQGHDGRPGGSPGRAQCGCPGTSTGRSTLARALPSESRTLTAFDPLNKQGYDLVFAGTRAIEAGEHSDVLATMGLSTHFASRSSGSKRIFLCKQYQAGRCRANRNCNSIHVCRAKVAALREEHPPTNAALEAEVLLPLRSEVDGGNLFEVPMDRTSLTRGRTYLLGVGSGTRGVLCPHYEGRRCAAEAACAGIHVDPAYLKHLRTLWRMPCCHECAGQHPQDSGEWQSLLLVIDGRGKQCPRAHVWPTKGLGELAMKGARQAASQAGDKQLRLPMGRVCRPHLRSACKWGPDCNNVHLCRKRFGNISQGQGQVSPPPPRATSPKQPRTSSPPSVAEEVTAPQPVAPAEIPTTPAPAPAPAPTAVREEVPQVLMGNESFGGKSDGMPSLCNDSLCSAPTPMLPACALTSPQHTAIPPHNLGISAVDSRGQTQAPPAMSMPPSAVSMQYVSRGIHVDAASVQPPAALRPRVPVVPQP